MKGMQHSLHDFLTPKFVSSLLTYFFLESCYTYNSGIERFKSSLSHRTYLSQQFQQEGCKHRANYAASWGGVSCSQSALGFLLSRLSIHPRFLSYDTPFRWFVCYTRWYKSEFCERATHLLLVARGSKQPDAREAPLTFREWECRILNAAH